VLLLAIKIVWDSRARKQQAAIAAKAEAQKVQGDEMLEQGEYAEAKGLYDQALKTLAELKEGGEGLKDEIGEVLASDPIKYGTDSRFVHFEDLWIKKEEKRSILADRFEKEQLAKGLVKFGDRWVTPEERDNIEKAAAEAKAAQENAAARRKKLAEEACSKVLNLLPKEIAEAAAAGKELEPLGNVSLYRATTFYTKYCTRLLYYEDEQIQRLGLPFRRLPATRNAAVYYLHAMVQGQMPTTPQRDWTKIIKEGWASATPKMEETLKANDAALRLAAAGASQEFVQFPYPRHPKGATFGLPQPHLFRLRSLGQLMLLNARRKQAQGEVGDALEECLRVYAMGDHLWRDVGVMPPLFGIALDGLASVVALDMLSSGELSSSQYDGLARRIGEIDVGHPALSEALSGEKTMGLSTLKLGDRAAREAFASAYDSVVADLVTNRPESAEAWIGQLKKEVEAKTSTDANAQAQTMAAGGELAGKTMAAMLAGSAVRVWENFQRDRTVLRALSMVSALHGYRAKHKKWPGALADLVPEHLPAVPVDPFDRDGKPFRYAVTKTGVRFYSVGIDRVDDGGKVNHAFIPYESLKPEEAKGRDAVFTLRSGGNTEGPAATREDADMTPETWADPEVMSPGKKELRGLFATAWGIDDSGPKWKFNEIAPDDSLKAAESAIRLAPQNGLLYLAQAHALLRKRAWQDALDSVKKANAQADWYEYAIGADAQMEGGPYSGRGRPTTTIRTFIALCVPKFGARWRVGGARERSAATRVERVESEGQAAVEAMEDVMRAACKACEARPYSLGALLQASVDCEYAASALLELYEAHGLGEEAAAIKSFQPDLAAWKVNVANASTTLHRQSLPLARKIMKLTAAGRQESEEMRKLTAEFSREHAKRIPKDREMAAARIAAMPQLPEALRTTQP